MFKKIQLNKIIKYHIIVWLIYTIYYSLIIKYFYDIPFSVAFASQAILQKLGHIFLFYTNAYWVLPRFWFVKKIHLLIITFFLTVLLYILYVYLLEFYIFQFLRVAIPNDTPELSQIISQAISNASTFIIFALGYYFSQRVIQQQKEISQKDVAIAQNEIEIANQKAVVAEQKVELVKKEKELAEEREKNAILAKEKAQAEMAFLRAQINPHFLFNSLNLIYSKIISAPRDVAGDAMIEFSNMMRYATSTKMQEDTVDLDGEITFVKGYLRMFKARNQQNAHIDYDDEGTYYGSHRVVPMVLVTIIENAFKHGLVDDPQNPLIVRVSLVDEFFVFMVRNLKNPFTKEITDKGNTGIGIPNLIKRLNAVYKDGGFTLESEDLGDDYVVTFTVDYNQINLTK
jgi:two-component system, LytTR family, sensor kinase